MAYESLERYRKAYVDYKTVLQIDMSVQAAHEAVNRYQLHQSLNKYRNLPLFSHGKSVFIILVLNKEIKYPGLVRADRFSLFTEAEANSGCRCMWSYVID